MALRDTWIALLGDELSAEALKAPETGLTLAIKPANGPGDWSGGFFVVLSTKEGNDTRLSWTSPVITTPGKPDTAVVLQEAKAVVDEIRARRAARG